MINPNDSIKLQNVLSKRYHFHYNDLAKVYEDFQGQINEKNVTVKGPFFYSLNNVPSEKIVDAELFLPVYEDDVLIHDQELKFHSYFRIDPMISLNIVNDLEHVTEVGYAYLFNHIKEQQLQQITPIFHIISGDSTLSYVQIKIGVA